MSDLTNCPCENDCEHRQHCSDEAVTCRVFRAWIRYQYPNDIARDPFGTGKPYIESFCRGTTFPAAKPQDPARSEEVYQYKLAKAKAHVDNDEPVRISIRSDVWRDGYRQRAAEIVARVRADLTHCTKMTQAAEFNQDGQVRPMILEPDF